MAKWGEGDPRWIVEDRPDATNVNNWHWTEKNASQWSIDKIKELLTKMKIEDSKCQCEITEVSKCEGESVVNNRKAKLIFFYEWNIILKWKGKLRDSDEEVRGKIEIPNLSEENEPQDVDVNVTLKAESPEGEIIKDMLRHSGTEHIRDKLAIYISTLKEEFSQGMILPTKDGLSCDSDKTTVEEKKPKKVMNGTITSEKDTSGVRLEMAKLTLMETFKCTADEMYRALTVSEMVQAFTQSPCFIECKKGGKFELFGGNVIGTFLDLEPNKKIKQRWRFKTWPDDHCSEVTFAISQKEDSTQVVVTQTGIPSNDFERTQEGWRRYYFESLKRTFGFGAHLF